MRPKDVLTEIKEQMYFGLSQGETSDAVVRNLESLGYTSDQIVNAARSLANDGKVEIQSNFPKEDTQR